MMFAGGGVEDTRLEAKARDTKHIRGQGQPFRAQTLLMPRTKMLEAKAKDQVHRRKCSNKKVLKKSFPAISKNKKIKVCKKYFKTISTIRYQKNFFATV